LDKEEREPFKNWTLHKSHEAYTLNNIPWPILTLIILFSEMLKFSKKTISFKSKNIGKKNSEHLGIFHVLKWIFHN
jgi:hypothetical protein